MVRVITAAPGEAAAVPCVIIVDGFPELTDARCGYRLVHEQDSLSLRAGFPAGRVYIFIKAIKIREGMRAMFWRKKELPWYLKAVFVLVVLRIIYLFARFFMKSADRHARGIDTFAGNKSK